MHKQNIPLSLLVDSSSFQIIDNVSKEVLVIDKIKNTIQLSKNVPTSKTNLFQIYGIYGILEAPSTNYLAVITRASSVGMIHNSEVMKIEEMRFFPCVNNLNVLENDKYVISLFTSFMKRNSLYFSETYDLTNSSLRYFNALKSGENYSILKNFNGNFCWNNAFLSRFANLPVERFVRPIMNGYVTIRQFSNSNNKETSSFVIISRKDNRRTGVRLIVRGCNENGNAANFVETEQLIIRKGNEINVSSYLIVRGSAPLIWEQQRDLSYTPKVCLNQDLSKQNATFQSHLTELKNNYGEMVFISLLDKRKVERALSDMYERVIRDKCEYVPFDFHYECKKNKYQNLIKILQNDYVSTKLSQQNWSVFSLGNDFLYGSTYNNVKTESTQKQFFRVNCFDSLDRANVVQSLLVRKMLQISGIPELNTNENFFSSNLEEIFINSWADNGDQLAYSYAGTKALKGDITRTGKRNIKGYINDGLFSVQRYLINNFTDGFNQDAHDYSLGRLCNFKTTQLKQHSLTLFYLVLLMSLIYVYFSLRFIHYLNPIPIKENDFKSTMLFSIFVGILFGFVMLFRKRLIDNSTNKH